MKPDTWAMLRPAINLAVLGLPIYGYTLRPSPRGPCGRWRATLLGSILTLAGFVALFISLFEVLQKMSWMWYVERMSIFMAYNPVEAIGGGGKYVLHLEILSGCGHCLHSAGVRGLSPCGTVLANG